MPYTALPDMRIPYDNDGTVVGYGDDAVGIAVYPSGAVNINLNSTAYSGTSVYNAAQQTLWFLFPEQREVTGMYATASGNNTGQGLQNMKGSNNTTNGQDGTWETASLPQGFPRGLTTYYDWRSEIKSVSFTGPKRAIRTMASDQAYGTSPWSMHFNIFHLYGEKAPGQTPDDVIYIDHDDTPGVEFTAPEDFGDQPLGTTVVRQFRVKNTSATKTANTINIQCNDSDFAISTDNAVWVVTINLASLGPGAESPTYYVRCTTPAPGNLLGPRFARIVTTVASYT